MKGFSVTGVIGMVDAFIHWQIFFVLYIAVGLDQAASNFAAFCVAASFSFYVNALYRFERETSVFAYLMFIVVMGALSFGVGVIADARHLPGLVTVAVFSLMNTLSGYCFFRFVLFRVRRA